MGDLLAISDLRRLTRQPDHVINHAIARFGPPPHGRIGITRVWLREDLPAIRNLLKRTASKSTIAERRQEETASA